MLSIVSEIGTNSLATICLDMPVMAEQQGLTYIISADTEYRLPKTIADGDDWQGSERESIEIVLLTGSDNHYYRLNTMNLYF